VLPDLRKALLSSTFSVLAKAAQISGSNAKALRFERHAVAEMDKIGFLQGLRAPGRPQEALDDVSRKTLDSLEAMERKNKFAELEIEGLRSQVDTLKSRALNPTAVPAPAAKAPAPAVPSPPSEKKYYGLDGLDRKLEVFLDYDNGYFVELGANDGLNQSNTCYFEKSRGWKGVLIEPVLHNFIKCKSNRSPENFFKCAACVGFDYPKETLRLLYSNLMTTPTGVQSDCPDPQAQARGGYQYIPSSEHDLEFHAQALTLHSILLEAKAPRVIDLLSLDVEGAEIEVLKGIDHAHFTFRYLLVECRRIDQLQEFLTPKGYSLVEKLSFHDYLFRNDACKI
jgi:FkbM family methyltransferase